MGYVKQTVAYNMTFNAYGNDVWEDVKIFIHSDSNFASPRSDGGSLIVLAGQKGTRAQWSGVGHDSDIKWGQRSKRVVFDR